VRSWVSHASEQDVPLDHPIEPRCFPILEIETSEEQRMKRLENRNERIDRMYTGVLSIRRVALALFFSVGLTMTHNGHAQPGMIGAPDQSTGGSDPLPVADEYSSASDNAGATGSAEGTTNLFDTDRGVVLTDTDGDGFPDLTESIELTNPLDPADYPGSDVPEAADEGTDPGFPATSCRSGYRQAGTRLCISTNVLNAASYANAMVYCRDRRGRVASYGDLRYLYVRSSLDAAYNPSGRWIGNFVDDDKALCGNRAITTNNDPDIGNFEGECSRFDSRNYWCAHDRF